MGLFSGVAFKDIQHHESEFRLSEKNHAYGKNVHILDDPFHQTLLARFCADNCVQPQANQLVGRLYLYLISQAISQIFPRTQKTVQTRMHALQKEATFEQQLVESAGIQAVTVDLMRAGILPSHLCYEILHDILSRENIRQDHILMNRETNDKNEVIGTKISGYKIGGPVDNAFVFMPDPMGATGSSTTAAIDLYLKKYCEKAPRKFIALHFIVTPEYLKHMKRHADVLEIFSLRLDRGLSSTEVLKTKLGEKWDKEKGLNENGYIVPGAGGIGEILNNSHV